MGNIVRVLATVDVGHHAPSLEKQQKYRCRKLSNVLLWTELAATYFSYLKNKASLKVLYNTNKCVL